MKKWAHAPCAQEPDSLSYGPSLERQNHKGCCKGTRKNKQGYGISFLLGVNWAREGDRERERECRVYEDIGHVSAISVESITSFLPPLLSPFIILSYVPLSDCDPGHKPLRVRLQTSGRSSTLKLLHWTQGSSSESLWTPARRNLAMKIPSRKRMLRHCGEIPCLMQLSESQVTKERLHIAWWSHTALDC